MLFEPFGKLLRIDLKRNYAFVQFQSIAEATAAKEATNGGKLDQSVLTVEYVARQRDRDDASFRNRGGPDRRSDSGYDRGGGRSASYDRGPMRYDDRGRGREDRPPPPRYPDDDRHRSYPPPPPMDDRRGMIDDRRAMVDDDRYARGRGGRDSPPPYSGRRRSRSRSPPGYRGRSPPVRGGRYPDDPMDEYHRGGRGGDYPPPPRGRSPPPSSRSEYVPDRHRASDRDHHRGYRG
jgi:RNA recognition motif-containing protein